MSLSKDKCGIETDVGNF